MKQILHDNVSVTDLGDGATTIVEVRGNFGETPTFAFGILEVGGRDDVGDDARGCHLPTNVA